jgi:hypothetical protein
MNPTRRQFLRVALTGAAALPLAGKALASTALRPEFALSDEHLLEQLERTAFDFFWNESHPATGLIMDKADADGHGSPGIASIAATGFGLTALAIGHKRSYRSQAEIENRVAQTLRFLAASPELEHGFFYHFVEPSNGERVRRSEISPIDNAILLCGVLTCREYFDSRAIQDDATTIFERVEWPWAMNGGKTFSLDWKPEKGFSRFHWDSYCESMMLYLLAIGSPTYPISADSWHAIRRPKMVYGGRQYISSPAPLFVHQFSHAWFDFRDKHDDYANYFENSVVASHAHREFCAELAEKFPCFSGDVWGITASDSSTGYVAWGGPPLLGPIDGSLVPAACAGSLPFTYQESISSLKNLRARYGSEVWKKYGFVDAFNPLTGWSSKYVLGIDAGISLLMAENARTQFVWNTFMRNPEAQLAMERVGFMPDGYGVPQFA